MQLTQDQQDLLLSTLHHRAGTFPRAEFIKKLVVSDKAYYMAEAERSAATDDKKTEVTSSYQETGIGIVGPAVESEVAFMNALFLSDPKIFSIVSDNKRKELASVIQSLNQQHAQYTGWSDQLLTFFRDNAKYNIGFIHTYWHSKQTYSRTAGIDVTEEQIANEIWAGNKLERLDPYNVGFDTSVTPSDIPRKGEFFYSLEKMTQVRLYSLLQEFKNDEEDKDILNDTAEMWASTNSNTLEALRYQEPPTEEIIPDFSEDGKMSQDKFNWYEFGDTGSAEGSPNRSMPKNDGLYAVATFYLRLIPAIYGLSTISESDKVQIWKIVVVNGKYIVRAKRETNQHDMIPVGVSQPTKDSLSHNTQGFSKLLIPAQKLAKELTDRRLASLDRNISDRAVYNPNYIDGEHLKHRKGDAKIPMKNTASEIDPKNAYMQIPFTDTTSQMFDKEMQYIQQNADELSGINKASRGQFVKGNKTLEEYQDVMSNADSKQYARANAIETQCFSVVKHILKWNLLQYPKEAELMDENTGQILKVDPTEMRKTVFNFKMADGLNPASKYLNAQEFLALMQMFQLVFQQEQAAGKPTPDLMAMMTHFLKQGKNIDLTQYIPTQTQA